MAEARVQRRLAAHQQVEDDAELDHEIGRGEQEREGWDECRALLE